MGSERASCVRRSVRHRVVYIAAGKATLIATLSGFVVSSVAGFIWFAAQRGSEPMLQKAFEQVILAVISVTLASCVSIVLSTIMFNIIAPRVGGVDVALVEVELVEESTSEALQRCPECKAVVRQGLSFCPECDDDFDAAPSSES